MKEYICNHKKEPCTKKVPLFAALSDVEMLKIARMTNHIHYQKGQMVIQEGVKSDTLFIMNSGKVKLSKFTVDGKEQILYILACGDFFGELNLFNDDEVNNFSVFAIEDTEICQLKKADIDLYLVEKSRDIIETFKSSYKTVSTYGGFSTKFSNEGSRSKNCSYDFGILSKIRHKTQ